MRGSPRRGSPFGVPFVRQCFSEALIDGLQVFEGRRRRPHRSSTKGIASNVNINAAIDNVSQRVMCERTHQLDPEMPIAVWPRGELRPGGDRHAHRVDIHLQ